MNIKPKNIMMLEKSVAIKWNDGSESFFSNKQLRDVCPCANCSGETDVFGTVYGGTVNVNSHKEKYNIRGYLNIGHYAIRIVWGDGHNSGIYSFTFLKQLHDNS